MKDEATGTSALDNCLFEGRGHKTGAVFLGNCIGNNLARKQIENHAYVVILSLILKHVTSLTQIWLGECAVKFCLILFFGDSKAFSRKWSLFRWSECCIDRTPANRCDKFGTYFVTALYRMARIFSEPRTWWYSSKTSCTIWRYFSRRFANQAFSRLFLRIWLKKCHGQLLVLRTRYKHHIDCKWL